MTAMAEPMALCVVIGVPKRATLNRMRMTRLTWIDVRLRLRPLVHALQPLYCI